jgi:asparagine synthase (glutamine-hydrolysing)
MCGIVGYAMPGGATADRAQLLEKQRDTMAHRGPDDRGIWISEDRCVGLAHRRLAIIDLSPTGHQPMASADRQCWVVYNGEIYNFLELRRELEGKGRRFDGHSDTEVLIAAYQEWGIECLARLNGMFALALYDARERVLWLARDRAGEKPLFYRETPGGLHFASELKSLFEDPGTPRVLDTRALSYYLAYGYVPGDMCLVEGIKKLPQATALRYDLTNGSSRLWRYWQLPDAEPTDEKTADELCDDLESLLGDAVQKQMMADVPVGVLLSGGTDSSIVAALAQRASQRAVKTFTISFAGHAAFDEAPFARRVADYLGTEHEELVAEPASVSLLPLLARQFDEPIADSSMVPTFIVSRLIREHATVALGGDGGDELFGGYLHHSWIGNQERLRRYVPSPVRELVGAVGSRMPPGTTGRNQLIGAAGNIHRSIAQINVYFDAATRRRLSPAASVLGTSPEAYKAALCRATGGGSRTAMQVDFQTYMVDDILVKVDRASMLASLEVRAPFLDYRVIEFAFGQVPDALRATTSERKVLLRRLGTRLLPADLDLRRKQGFTLPLSAWLAGEWGEYITAVLRDAPAALLDPREVDTLLRDQQRGRSNMHRIFSLAMLELWRREYDITIPQ